MMVICNPLHPTLVAIAVGVTVSITLIMSSLGVVTIWISYIIKTRSKITSPHPSTPGQPYEVVGIDQKKIDVIPLETNNAYGTVVI